MAAAVKATGDAASAAGAGRVAGEGMALTLSVQGRQGRWGALTSTPRTAPLGEISAPFAPLGEITAAYRDSDGQTET